MDGQDLGFLSGLAKYWTVMAESQIVALAGVVGHFYT